MVISEATNAQIDDLALRIDAASDDGNTAALESLDFECAGLLGSGGPPDALLHYFRSNVQDGLQSALAPRDWAWRQLHRERQVLYLRLARTVPSFDTLSSSRRAQILTNLANQLSTLGRPIEALRLYEIVLMTNPRFAMALANRGLVRFSFARMVHDDGHRAVLAAYACRDLERVVDPDLVWESAPTNIISLVKTKASEIRAAVDVDMVLAQTEMDGWPLGVGEAKAYRLRMLNRRLFLNPLIVLGPHSIAAHDSLHLPSHTFAKGTVPPLLGWYNQMKQEFVGARLLYHEAMEAAPLDDRPPHFADYEVRLYDTLDYPAFSIGVERLRLAFRTAYGLLDKIAGFVNSYFELGHDPNRVDLRGVWYVNSRKRCILHPKIADRPNLALRGLYWLSFDIVGDAKGSADEPDDTLAPEAAHLNTLRNALEHRCLVLTTETFRVPDDDGIERVGITSFQHNTERMLELVCPLKLLD
ncbi:LA2681 family HEPN domain-containing protein [Jiella sp. M17.18]|uniref:LA2681 family HEPN domain-containing protein n=1 Tax=Jiella sp. M17.18 TaxID=3234247 RepID=UPI0034DE6A5B